ncbi:C40 family peptidase [Actinomadura algeriensis]|uniref:NlpC/P60 domain-containing protein n=1 Tax=Actinomadura algeriensis TaxID=1679523 RepID=A0ABR9JQL4_9ACTN|nr:NlpC/P60 family protein [Actinomadura algeriensis]MBE1532864.1 hypothetical protein [Actinomadura algeriensis]
MEDVRRNARGLRRGPVGGAVSSRTLALSAIGFGGLGCGGVAGVTILVVLLTVMTDLIPGVSAITAVCAPSGAATTGVVPATATAEAGAIPRNYFELYHEAGTEWNVPWNVLAGIGWVETHHGTLDAPGVLSGENFAGAGGPMQFLQSTFDRAKVDGDGDGVTSRYDPADAIFSAAKLLKLHIQPGASTRELKARTLTAAELRRSIYSYNHSDVYVGDVLAAANGYAESQTLAPANHADRGCGAPSSTGSFGRRVADAAAYYAVHVKGAPQPPTQVTEPVPYSWGGGGLDGPSRGVAQGADTVGFDCSGLARYAVYKASEGKILMPRTTWEMWDSDKGEKVTREELQPGDLVFFNKDLSHMGIYYGEFDGKRWMVEAPRTGDVIKFSDFDARAAFAGALRVPPPPGEQDRSPEPIRAMPAPGASAGEGAI